MELLTIEILIASARQLFEQAPGFISILRGPQHIYEFTNASHRALVGRADLIGKPAREALPDLVNQGFFEILDRVYATGEAFVGRAVPISLQRDSTSDPKTLFVDIVYQPIVGPDGSVTAIFVQGSDVSDAWITAQELRDREARLRLVVENAKDHLILTTDPDGIITSWSSGAEMVCGWGAEEVIGRNVSLIFTPEDREEGADVTELETARALGSAPDERWHIRKDARRVFLNGTMNRLPLDAQGAEQGFLKIARDETERRSVEDKLHELRQTLEQRVEDRTRELQDAEHRYSLAALAASAAVWDWDLASERVTWTGAVNELLGGGGDQERNTASWWKAHVHPEDREAVIGSTGNQTTGAPNTVSERLTAATSSFTTKGS
jgi:PAS domain S-box-containing protein